MDHSLLIGIFAAGSSLTAAATAYAAAIRERCKQRRLAERDVLDAQVLIGLGPSVAPDDALQAWVKLREAEYRQAPNQQSIAAELPASKGAEMHKSRLGNLVAPFRRAIGGE